MRKLSPTKAISHALNSVWTYRRVAARIALPWLPVLLLCGIAEIYFAPPLSELDELPQVSPLLIAILVVSLVPTSAISVSWHRFILRDELRPTLLIDTTVLRYFGFSMMMFAVTILLLAIVLLVLLLLAPPLASALSLPASLLVGSILTRLWIKFPAISLENNAFGFFDAWKASEGNFWQCLGLLLMILAIMLASILVNNLISGIISHIDDTLGRLSLITGAAVAQLFLTIVSASVFASLYGFFVERREF